MHLHINCKHCKTLRKAEVIGTVIMDILITSDIRCLVCNTVHAISYKIESSIRKYIRKTEELVAQQRPLLDDEQVEYGATVGHNEH